MAAQCNAQMTAYDHWHCQRGRWHLGPHRFNNYLGARFPRVWRLRALRTAWTMYIRLRRYDDYRAGHARHEGVKAARQALWPCRYAPIEYDRLLALRRAA
jgi:hypothetical protein